MFRVVLGLSNLGDWQIIYYVYGRTNQIHGKPNDVLNSSTRKFLSFSPFFFENLNLASFDGMVDIYDLYIKTTLETID